MLEKICFVIMCVWGILGATFMIIDYKRAEKGKKAILFEIDNDEEE